MPQAASIEELLKVGAHFGHLTRRWNPKMKEFIFMNRNGIHVIDLNKTRTYLQESLDEIAKVARSGKKVLFVGTKKQAQEIIKKEADRCDMPYITDRWLGGMLTNFVTIRKSISRMDEIATMQRDGTYDNITKKERLMLDREKGKLEKVLAGISKMNRLPGALFIVDIVKEKIAINEALKLNIPIFAIVDTNCDPDVPDYIIPANDDAAKAIQLITANVADAIIEGNAEREQHQEEQLALDAIDKADSEAASEGEEEVEVKTLRKKRGKRKSTSNKSDNATDAEKALEAKPDEKPAEEKKADDKKVEKKEKEAPAEAKKADSKKEEVKEDAKAEKKEPEAEKKPAEAEKKSE